MIIQRAIYELKQSRIDDVKMYFISPLSNSCGITLQITWPCCHIFATVAL